MEANFKPFHQMTDSDYARIGLRAGLEIHQQLQTEKKLFCRCPAGLYSHEYHAEILRHMRPTLSELGEYDGTALMEFKTRKEIIYQINHQTVCTYEMDDTPPFEINRQALDIALEIAMLLNYKMVSEIHVARKQYLDGSIPTGFQRTTIVGIDGWLPFGDRKIGLYQLGLEEDACREVSDIGHQRIYLTDRLGMPLIEMVTRPEMQTPQEVAEVANRLRWLVRSTGKVRTGIGAARQDVNVSITGGTRIEIKGVARIPLIPLLIYNEARRQHALLEIRKELHARGINQDTFKALSTSITHLLQNTSWDPIRRALKRGEEIHCVNLKGFEGILRFPTQSGKVFSRELADRVRVVACLTRIPNILTSDNPEETIESSAWKRIRKKIRAEHHDALILVWGEADDLKTAVSEIIGRAKEATRCIPSETRQALSDGTNGFERILPGPNRMYPDTDLPPMEITEAYLKKLRRNTPEPLWEREERYIKMGVPHHLLFPVANSSRAKLFEDIAETYQVPLSWVLRIVFDLPRKWERRHINIKKLSRKDWQYFFQQAEKEPVLLEQSTFLFEKYLREGGKNFEIVLNRFREGKTDLADPRTKVREILESPKIRTLEKEKKFRHTMAQMMKTYRGYMCGKEVAALVRLHIKKRDKL
ncbi:MAG: Glu-tRNA(Gln) amidotransferase subunit GatE [Calditrichales bacterium]|nr:MAG: Glu-tRNA(Gln) amidotransferase subunit GatE [Calditrichales bacterium]